MLRQTVEPPDQFCKLKCAPLSDDNYVIHVIYLRERMSDVLFCKKKSRVERFLAANRSFAILNERRKEDERQRDGERKFGDDY